MKTSTRRLKVVALFFSVLILLQGCTVYKKANVTLEEAVTSDTKVRIKTNDNKTLKFKKIGIENGDYYGLLNYKSAWVKTQINEGNIEKIQVKDKTASTILNIIVPLAILTTVIVTAPSRGLLSDGVKCNPCNE